MTTVLNSFRVFLVRCISGVLSESNPVFRKLGVPLSFLFFPTGDGASTLGGLLKFLSLHASMNDVLTWEFLLCFIGSSSEGAFCVLGIQCLNYARCISNESSGILKIQLHWWA